MLPRGGHMLSYAPAAHFLLKCMIEVGKRKIFHSLSNVVFLSIYKTIIIIRDIKIFNVFFQSNASINLVKTFNV